MIGGNGKINMELATPIYRKEDIFSGDGNSNTKKVIMQENYVPNMDGYHLDETNKLKMISIDGDRVEVGNVEIKVDQDFEWTDDIIQKYKEQVALEKKYGVHGIIITNLTPNKKEELYGSLMDINIDAFITSAHGKVEGLTEKQRQQVFNTSLLAEKIYGFFNDFNGSFANVKYLDSGSYDVDEIEAINSLKGQLDEIFNELTNNISAGKGDSIRALEGKLSINGYEVTLAEVLDIKDGFKASLLMNNDNYSYFSGFTNGISEYAYMGLRHAYFDTYANQYLSEEAAGLGKSTFEGYVNGQILDHEKFLNDLQVSPGMEKIHPNAPFKGTYKEQLYKIFAEIDSSSEQDFLKGISSALGLAGALEYSVIINRGGGDDYAQRCVNTTKYFLDQYISRIRSFDTVRTTK